MVSIPFGEAFVAIRATFGEIDKDIQTFRKKLTKGLDKVGDDVADIGEKFSTYITAPLVLAAGFAVHAFAEEDDAVKKLGASIKMTGGDVEDQLEFYKDWASSLQAVTTTADDVTLKNIQVARSMGLTATQAANAAKNAIALSKTFGVNEESAIRMTSALEQGNADMLGKYIPTLKSIKDDSEKAAVAQEILGNSFATAMAEAEGGLGPLKQLSNDLSDLGESFGEIILNGVNPWIQRGRQLIKHFQDLSPEVKKTVVEFAGMAAIVGPAILGVAATVRTMSFLLGGFMSRLLLVPILASAAVSGLEAAFSKQTWVEVMAKHFGEAGSVIQTVLKTALDNILPPLEDVDGAAKDFAKTQEELNAKVNAFGQGAGKAGGIAKQYSIDLDEATDSIREMTTASTLWYKQSTANDDLNEMLSQSLGSLKNELDGFTRSQENAWEIAQQSNESFKELGFTMSSAFEDAIVNGNSLREVMKGLYKDIVRIAIRKGITEPLGNAFAGWLGGIKGFASGGVPPVGVPSIVGERGPELFVPSTSGRIIPNSKLDSGTGTVNQSFHFPMAFPAQLEAYIRNVASPVARATAMQVVQSGRGRI